MHTEPFMERFQRIFEKMPIVAIIRGVSPDEAVSVARSILNAGIRIVEVPLNSPAPFESIRKISEQLPNCITGAGTVLSVEDVKKVKQAGGRIIVSPNTDPEVIQVSIAEQMIPLPGFQTITEALIALNSGATYLKLFPASSMSINHIKSIKAVLPATCKILAVGGTSASNLQQWHQAAADGYGIGSEIYKPGMSPEQVEQKTREVVDAVQQLIKIDQQNN